MPDPAAQCAVGGRVVSEGLGEDQGYGKKLANQKHDGNSRHTPPEAGVHLGDRLKIADAHSADRAHISEESPAQQAKCKSTNKVAEHQCRAGLDVRLACGKCVVVLIHEGDQGHDTKETSDAAKNPHTRPTGQAIVTVGCN